MILVRKIHCLQQDVSLLRSVENTTLQSGVLLSSSCENVDLSAELSYFTSLTFNKTTLTNKYKLQTLIQIMAECKRRKCLSLKQLESYLQEIDDFSSPIIDLEQYATPPHIAALMINTIDNTYDDLRDKFVADLGCGTGRLTIGSLLCDAAFVCGFDIDAEALKIGLNNLKGVFSESEADTDDEYLGSTYRDCSRVNFLQVNLKTLQTSKVPDPQYPLTRAFDTVIMNPPFGTKHNQGLDVLFLEKAIQLTNDVVYSLHKTSTREHIHAKCLNWGVHAKPIAQIRYNLENTYKFHKRKSVDINVDFWRIKVH